MFTEAEPLCRKRPRLLCDMLTQWNKLRRSTYGMASSEYGASHGNWAVMWFFCRSLATSNARGAGEWNVLLHRYQCKAAYSQVMDNLGTMQPKMGTQRMTPPD